MLQNEYENLPIVEKAEVYSSTEEGYILICTRKGSHVPMYKWKDVYLKLEENLPQNTEELKSAVLFGHLDNEQAEELLKFISSINKQKLDNFTVHDVIHVLWEAFYDSLLDIETVNQD